MGITSDDDFFDDPLIKMLHGMDEDQIFGKDKDMTCDRCKEKAPTLQMSIFNTEMICPNCLSNETSHPKHEQAREAEKEAISRGDLNFPGIGLPDDLKISHERKPKE